MVTLRLLLFQLMKYSVSSTAPRARPRPGSPMSGCSTLTTSAPSHASDCVHACVDQFGRLDVLCNIAGILRFDHFDELDANDWNRILAVNLTGTFLMCKAALPHLLESGGNIVNTSSTSALAGLAYGAAYGASKAALISWTRVMAQEWTPRGVRVNGLTPGSVATDMILPEDPERRERFEKDMASQNLFQRIADPAEMVGPVLFLASDASSFMTGQILVVDGGLMA